MTASRGPRHRAAAACWIGALLASSACSTAPALHWYSLDERPEMAAGAATAAAGGAGRARLAEGATSPGGASVGQAAAPMAVLLGPVAVPEGVDRVQMVVRTSANRIEVLDGHRWTEPLGGLLLRGLAVRLAARLPGSRVATIADALPGAQPVRVAVDVLAMDALADREVAMQAAWSVRGPRELTASGESRIVVPTTGPGQAALAAAHGRVLDRLADELAAAITRQTAGR